MLSICAYSILFGYIIFRISEVYFRKGIKGAITHRTTFTLLLLSTSFLALGATSFISTKNSPLYCILGLTAFCMSILLRQCAAKALGKFWSFHIELRTNHQVIKTGPYKYIKHPIYSSILLEALGFILLAPNLISTLLVIFFTLPVLLFRLYKEEQIMCTTLGLEYQEYSKSTKALIPFII